MNVELKRIGTISLDKSIPIEKVIYRNPKMNIKVAQIHSKFDNENRYALYIDDSVKSIKESE